MFAQKIDRGKTDKLKKNEYSNTLLNETLTVSYDINYTGGRNPNKGSTTKIVVTYLCFPGRIYFFINAHRDLETTGTTYRNNLRRGSGRVTCALGMLFQIVVSFL